MIKGRSGCYNKQFIYNFFSLVTSVSLLELHSFQPFYHNKVLKNHAVKINKKFWVVDMQISVVERIFFL